MIQLIKYNKPTINGKIYTKGCFHNIVKVKKQFFIQKPSFGNTDYCVDLSNIIFVCTLRETKYGLYIKDLTFINTEDNLNFLNLFENQKLGIALSSIGNIVENNQVVSSEIIKAVLVINPDHANATHDFTFDTGIPRLILEFTPLIDYDRYGEKYVSSKPHSFRNIFD